MIEYKKGGIHILLNNFRMSGSVFPHSMMVAFPSAMLAGLFRLAHNYGYWSPIWHEDSILTNNAIWSGFSFLVGFLIVFRTSQAYARFWDGCTSSYNMRAEWFDACCSLVAFCKYSTADDEAIFDFQNLMIRLFSMLHAAALAEIEEYSCHSSTAQAYEFELIDVQGIDEETLETIKDCDCKVEMIFAWIQTLVVENMKTGVLSVPAPILSRAFQEIANGMVAYHDATKISAIPLPFPYAQCCDALLLLQWCLSPFVFAKWCLAPGWAAVFCFTQVFMLWALNFIAVEIENPFGTDPNDLDGRSLQEDMNRSLKALLSPAARRLPTLDGTAMRYERYTRDPSMSHLKTGISFQMAWDNIKETRSFQSRISNFGGGLWSSAKPLPGVSSLTSSRSRPKRDSQLSAFSISVGRVDRSARPGADSLDPSTQSQTSGGWEPIGRPGVRISSESSDLEPLGRSRMSKMSDLEPLGRPGVRISKLSDLESGSPSCFSSEAPKGVRFEGQNVSSTAQIIDAVAAAAREASSAGRQAAPPRSPASKVKLASSTAAISDAVSAAREASSVAREATFAASCAETTASSIGREATDGQSEATLVADAAAFLPPHSDGELECYIGV